MHPATSVIFFTTASGAGYGLLALMAVLGPAGLLPAERWFGATGLVLALALVTAGLLSSTFHLGHPERAWRAFSQWRTSWLSREGVLSVLTYAPALVLAWGWVIAEDTSGVFAAAGLAAAALTALTVVSTGMIYASLPPIAQWRSPYTVPGYLLFALMTGAVLLNALAGAFGIARWEWPALAALVTAAGWAWKTATWRRNDRLASPASPGSATSLGGTVRTLEWPHTEENYVMKEMGYRIARRHAAKLRRLTHALAFAAPLAACLVCLATGGAVALVAALAAVACQAVGIAIERWLFFAEARHTVMLYYGAEVA